MTGRVHLCLFLGLLSTGIRADLVSELNTGQIKTLGEAQDALDSILNGNCSWLGDSEPRIQALRAKQNLLSALRDLEERSSGALASFAIPRSPEYRQVQGALKKAHESLKALDAFTGEGTGTNYLLAHTIPDLQYLKIATEKTPLPVEMSAALLKAAIEGDDQKVQERIKAWNATRVGREPVAVTRYTPLVGSSGSPDGGDERVLFSIPGEKMDLLVQVRPPAREMSIIGMEKNDNGHVGWFRDVALEQDFSETKKLRVQNSNACTVCHENSTPNVPYAKAIAWQEPAMAFSIIQKRAGVHQGKDSSSPYERPLKLSPSKISAPKNLAKNYGLSAESLTRVEQAADCNRCHDTVGGFSYGYHLILNGAMPKDMELSQPEREAAAELYLYRLCDSLKEKLQIQSLVKMLEPIASEAGKIRASEAQRAEAEIRESFRRIRQDHESQGKTAPRPTKNDTK